MLEVLLAVSLIFIYLGWQWWQYYSTKKGAPFIPLEPEVIEEIMLLSQIDKKDVFYDLGSGDGRIVVAAALRGAKSVGVELDSFRVNYSRVWINMLGLSKIAKIIKADLFKTDISEATIVCTYLLPETHEKLESKLLKELKPGTKVVAVAFEYDNLNLKYISPVGPIYGPLMLYEIPGKNIARKTKRGKTKR